MPVRHELRKYNDGEKVWAGKYRNSHNMPHWHRDCELLYVESGSIDVFCRGKNRLLRPGEAMFIQSGEIHYMKAREETYLLVIIFTEELMKTVAGNSKLVSPRLSDPSLVPAAYAELRRELFEKKPFYAAIANARTQELVARILRGEKTTEEKESESGMGTLKRLLDDVEEHYENYTFERAAAFVGFSEAYFSRLFHKQMGMTFSAYLNHVRVRHAVRLLRERPDISMTELSIMTGYTTIRNFNRMFRTITGYAPRELPESAALASEDGGDGDPTLDGCILVE